MISTLGYAVLGLLAREPLTGYRITQRLRTPIGYFWTASHSQVYPELARLAADGLVVSDEVAGPGPRQNKRHHLTDAGRDALAAWVVTTPREDNRDELLLRVYSMWLADPARAGEMMTEQLGQHRARLREYRRIEKALLAEHGGDPPRPDQPAFGDYATLRRGLSFERYAVDWCRWVLQQLDTTPDTSS
ncbi:MAG: PadR family transcriptional regulator [Marmoricola sp.]